jgi:hypothetical protein
MNKYIYKGKAIYASSKKEALAQIVAFTKQQKVLGSATADIKTWIQTTLAGVLGSYVNSDTEKKLFDSCADQLAVILNEFYTWNDSTKRYVSIVKFNEADLPILAIKKLKSFEELENFVKEFYSDDTMEVDYQCAKKLTKVISEYLKEIGVKVSSQIRQLIEAPIMERLLNNMDIRYPTEQLLDEEFTCNVTVPLMEPRVMQAVFGTQDLAVIVNKFVKSQLPKKLYEALRLCFVNESRNIDLSSFETVLLVLSRIISEIKLKYLDKLTLKQIISTYDSDNNMAVKEISFNDKYDPSLFKDGPKMVNHKIDINGEVTVNSEIVTAKIII